MTGSFVDLSKYSPGNFNRGRPSWVEWGWRIISALFFLNPLFPFYAPKRFLLRLFGARIGKGVLIKPQVKITFPWKLEIGDFSWIGEEVWLDNLEWIRIGSNAVISQRAYLCTGNHDYKDPHFALRCAPIEIGDGAWVGASAVVAPGIKIANHSIVALGTVVLNNVDQTARR